MPQPIPYKGNEPYIFISYAHRDAASVLPIIEQLQCDGFRVWYDEGIAPGTEWDENIATHLFNCAFFIAIISKNYVLSDNCKDELHYARDLEKPQVLLYKEKVALPRGMELRMSRCPSYQVDSRKNFYKKLYQENDLSACHSVELIREGNRRPHPAILLGVLAAVLCIVAAITLFNKDDRVLPPTEATAPATSQATEAAVLTEPAAIPETTEPVTIPETTEPAQKPDVTMQEAVVMDQNGIKVTMQGIRFEEDGSLWLDLLLENQTQQEGMLFLGPLQMNGIYCDYRYTYLQPGASQELSVWWTAEDLRKAGLAEIQDIYDVKVLEGGVYFADYQTHGKFIYYPFGEDYGILPDAVTDETDILMAEDGTIQVYMTDSIYDETNQWIVECLIINHSTEVRDVEIRIEQINGYKVQFDNFVFVQPNGWAKVRIPVNEWQDTDQDRVTFAKGEIISYIWPYAEWTELPFQIYPEGDAEQAVSVRELTEEDEILLENEYVCVALVGAFSSSEKSAYRLYCKNLSQETMTVSFSDFSESGMEHLIGQSVLAPGEQMIETHWFMLSVEEKPESISVTVCGIKNNVTLFQETIEVVPEW